MERVVVFAGVEYDVRPLPLGRIKKILPAFGSVSRAFSAGVIDDSAMDDIVTIISLGLGITREQAEEIPVSLADLIAAIPVIADVCGLVPPEEDTPAGKAMRALASIGMSSTHG